MISLLRLLKTKKTLLGVTYLKKLSSYGTNEFIYQLKTIIMAAGILVPTGFFLMVFGIVYLFLSTRNKERLALIEKGMDANIFVRDKGSGFIPGWKIFLINFAILLISVGVAIFLASIIEEMGVYAEVAYTGTIFTLAGIGLLVGFNMTKKLEKEN